MRLSQIKVDRILHDAINRALSADGSPLPPFPVINLNEQPPEQSDRITLGTSSARLGLRFDSMHSSDGGMVDDTLWRHFPNSDWVIEGYDEGSSRPDYTLTLRRYWQRVDWTQVPALGSFERTYDAQYGLSTTTTQSISAELGVSVDGLGASLTADFSETVTISTQESVSTKYTATAPANEIVVWVIWQLVDEIVALKPDGTPVTAGQVATGTVTSSAPGDHDAWLYIDQPVTTLPYNTFIPRTTPFPAVASAASKYQPVTTVPNNVVVARTTPASASAARKHPRAT